MLSDRGIHYALNMGWITITPIEGNEIQANSVDLHLSPHFLVFHREEGGIIDPSSEMDCFKFTSEWTIPQGGRFRLWPGQFVLGSTLERVTFNNEHAGSLEGKSSLGRLGLEVHSTSGFFDAGFAGYPTLEISSKIQQSILLWPGMPICQMAFFKLSSPALRPYTGKYADQGPKPRASEYWRNTWKDPRE